MAEGPKESPTAKSYKDSTVSAVALKYLAEVDGWRGEPKERNERQDDAQYRKRLLNAIETRLADSCRGAHKSKTV